MASLTVRETRTVSDTDEGQKFYLRVYCTGRGDLPDTGIFLHKVFNDLNPDADVFQRVTTVADIETYDNHRDDAIKNRDDLWRSSELTLIYDDLEVANQAVRVIKDRINTLATDWDLYITEYKTDPHVDLSFPTAEETYVNELKTAYATAVSDYEAAVASGAVALAEYEIASANLSSAQDDLAEWQAEYSSIYVLASDTTATRSLFYDLLNATTYTPSNANSMITALTTFFAAHPEFVSPSPDPVYTEYLAFRTTYQYALGHASLVETDYSDHQSKLTSTSGTVADKQALVKTAEDELQSKKASQIEADAAIQEAYDNVISAYEAVKAVCPSWSPSPPLPAHP